MIPTLYLAAHYLAPITALVLVQVVAGLPRSAGGAGGAVAWAAGWPPPWSRCAWWTTRPRWPPPGGGAGIPGAFSPSGKKSFATWSPTASGTWSSCGTRPITTVTSSGSTTGRTSTGRKWFAARNSPGDDARLCRYFAGRKVWLLLADVAPPRLLPYGDPRCDAYPRRAQP